MGNAGVLINEKHYNEIAEMIQLVVENETFRQEILDGQTARLEYFRKEKIIADLFDYLEI
jgi:hypothetical protein